MESEYIANVKIRDIVNVYFVYSKSKVCLLRVQVNIRSDGCIRFSVDSFAWWESDDEIGADDLSGSFKYGDQKHGQFRVENQLEALTLFIASDILVDEGVYEWLPIVMLYQL